MKRNCFIFTLLILTSGGAAAAPGHGKGFQGEFLSAAIQGDLSTLVERIDAPATPQDDPFLARVRRRFGPEATTAPNHSGSPLLDAVLDIYHAFWRECLRGEVALDQDEAILGERLRPVLEPHGLSPGEDALDALPEVLTRLGFHSQTGRTRPLLDLYVWRTQSTQIYAVDLSDTTISVSVHFMDDYVSPGWIHFATLGLSSAGGWANDNGLFCRARDYDVESERFTASYLKHESRHYADYVMFPALEQTDLEYRAKLTELMYARGTLFKLLADFQKTANPNPASPHALASYAVIRELEQFFDGDPGERSRQEIHHAAAQLLSQHTQDLRHEGAATIKGLIPTRYTFTSATSH